MRVGCVAVAQKWRGNLRERDSRGHVLTLSVPSLCTYVPTDIRLVYEVYVSRIFVGAPTHSFQRNDDFGADGSVLDPLRDHGEPRAVFSHTQIKDSNRLACV
jgi:hypothetical protein